MPEISIAPKARKRFSQLPTSEKQKIARAIGLLKTGQLELLNIRALRLPKAKMFRVRVGNIRIIYEIASKNSIHISIIDFRGNIY